MIRSFRIAMLAGLGLLAANAAARAEIDPLTRQPLMQYADPAKAQATAIPREIVSYDGKHRPGTIVINTTERRLYFVLPDGKAVRYGVGVGRPGFDWAGSQTISRKQEWPTWTPPAQMLKRRPDLPRFMPGGPENPMGARALYLGSTLYRIHGSNEPETIGQAVSSGCIRMTNEDVIDLYKRVKVGAKVVVLD
jgi:lipoprotein-anchoring transpeptidase ErfK/SrfK